ncbi:MAG TPA: HNH endonuclease signature motif containing protein, partial [Pseudonocardia sp.]
ESSHAESGQAQADADQASQPATPTQPDTPTQPNTPTGPRPGSTVEPDSGPARAAEQSTSQVAARGDLAPGGTTRNPGGRLTGVEVSVQLATLLGRNDHPATIPGLGPVLADVARRVVARQRGAQWRYTLLNSDGHFVFGGITRPRPTGTDDHSHGGIIELLIPTDLLAELTHHPPEASEWTQVIVDIAAQYRDHKQQLRDIDADPDRRFPTAALRRHIQQRDRACVGPGCRRPASKSEFDHTREYQHHGPTTSTNGGPVCTHDHNLKTKAGWTLHQPKPGQFTWHTPLGQTHHSHITAEANQSSTRYPHHTNKALTRPPFDKRARHAQREQNTESTYLPGRQPGSYSSRKS